MTSTALQRAEGFCARFGLRVPILLAPMAGASAPSLSIAVANAGGLGACGVLLMQPDEILSWAKEVRAKSNGAFQLNTWIPILLRNATRRMKRACVTSLVNGGPKCRKAPEIPPP